MSVTEIRAFLKNHRVCIRPATSSWFLRCCAVVLGWFGVSLARYWQTLGRTIYHPLPLFDVDNDADLTRYSLVLEHEFVHIRQWERWWILFPILWAVFPLPFWFAYGRWYFEREAYLVQFRAGTSIDELVDTLAAYGRPWPRKWMRSWWRQQQKDD